MVLTIKPRIAGAGHSSLWPEKPQEWEKERLPFTDPGARASFRRVVHCQAGSAVYEPQHPAHRIYHEV